MWETVKILEEFFKKISYVFCLKHKNSSSLQICLQIMACHNVMKYIQ